MCHKHDDLYLCLIGQQWEGQEGGELLYPQSQHGVVTQEMLNNYLLNLQMND